MHATYLLINVCSAIVPFLFSFYPSLRFDKHFKAFIAGNLIMAVCFIAWDALFTSWGVWGFNERYLLGYKLLNLPLEEVQFFVFIPFACTFTYHCLNKFYNFNWPLRVERVVVVVLSALLLLLGFVNIDKAYTASSSISTAVLLLLLEFVFKVKWLPKFLSIYPILLIPFFIVNGLLTGTGLEQPVVWYNDAENLGIRMLTIPVEDVAYGLEMLVFNIFLYELFKPVFTPAAATVEKHPRRTIPGRLTSNEV